MKYFIDVLKKYAVFTGRARRKEYWMFALFSTIISIILSTIDTGIGIKILSNIYSVAVLLPSIGVGVRRMHDINKSGWYIIIPIYNIILACKAGDVGPNQYGQDPKSDGPYVDVNNPDILDSNM